MRNWIKTDYPGVEYRKHEICKHGVQFDYYYRGRYMVNKKIYITGLGRTNKGWGPKKAFIKEYQANARAGVGPTTLKEEHQIEEESGYGF